MSRGITKNIRTLYKWLLDNLLTLRGVSTLQNKTLDSTNIVNAASLLTGVESGINTSAADVTLSATQKKKHVLIVSTGHAANAIIAPAENRVYLVINTDAVNAALIKKAAGTAVTIPAGKAALVVYNGTEYVAVADNQVTLTGTETMTNKTLTSPVLNTPKIGDGGTGLTVTSADQTHAAPTATIPNITDAADEFVMKDTTQTLTLKTLTAPVITAPDLTLGVASHDYAGAAAAWTLSAAELKASRIIVTNANGAVDAIATPTAGKMYIILNTSGQALTFKATGQTGVVLASTKSAIVIGNGTDFIRVTADA